MFTSHCEHCQSRNEVPQHYRGKDVKCCQCGHDFVALPDDERPFKFGCPLCEGPIEATPEHVGASVTCPHCDQVFTVPDPHSPPPKPPPTPEGSPVVPHEAQSYVDDVSRVSAPKKSSRLSPIGIGILAVAVLGGGLIYLNHKSGGNLSVGSILQTTKEIVEIGYVADRSYSSEIRAVLSQQSLGDIGTDSAIQQCANGAFRLGEMTAIIARQLDKDGSSRTAISAVLSARSLNDISSKGAVQQAANGIYRCVDLLVIAAREADRDANSSASIRSIESDLSLKDISAGSAYQQIANGSFRMAELLALLCQITDKDGEFGGEVRSVISAMNISEISSRSAMHQSTNGLYSSCKLMAIFAKIMDRDSSNSSDIRSELSQLSLNDISTDSAYQQMANGFYRLTALAGLAADGLNP